MAGDAPPGVAEETPHCQQASLASPHPQESNAPSHTGHPEQLLQLYHQRLEPDTQLATCEHAQPETLTHGDSKVLTSESTQPKNSRWIISRSAQFIMEQVFTVERFPTCVTRARLALDLGATPRQIQVWFQNRRQRERSVQRPVGGEQALGAYIPGGAGAVRCGPGGRPIMPAHTMRIAYNGMHGMPGAIAAQTVMVIKQDGSVQPPVFGKQPCQQSPTIAYPLQPNAIGTTEHLAAEPRSHGLHSVAPNPATAASPHLIAAAHLSSDATVGMAVGMEEAAAAAARCAIGSHPCSAGPAGEAYALLRVAASIE